MTKYTFYIKHHQLKKLTINIIYCLRSRHGNDQYDHEQIKTILRGEVTKFKIGIDTCKLKYYCIELQ